MGLKSPRCLGTGLHHRHDSLRAKKSLLVFVQHYHDFEHLTNDAFPIEETVSSRQLKSMVMLVGQTRRLSQTRFSMGSRGLPAIFCRRARKKEGLDEEWQRDQVAARERKAEMPRRSSLSACEMIPYL